MKSMLTSEQLTNKIIKAAQLNTRLKQTLRNQQSLYTPPQTSRTQATQSTSQSKLMTNIEDRIKIYKHEIAKLDGVTVESYFVKAKDLQEQIKDAFKKKTNLDLQIKILQEQLNKKQKKETDTAVDYNFYTNQVEVLKKRLFSLQKYTNSQPQPQQMQRSYKNRVKSTTSLIQQPKQQKNEDKAAPLYRNLIKYYEKQEERLQKQIHSLGQGKKEQKQKFIEIEAEITRYEALLQNHKKQSKFGKIKRKQQTDSV